MGCKNSTFVASKQEFSSSDASQEEVDNHWSHWRLLNVIGQGAFSHVYAVEHKKSRRLAALKIPIGCDSQNNMIRSEAKIWRKVGSHAHIVDLIGGFVVESNAILMEKCDTTLTQYIKHMKVDGELAVAGMLNQMASALAHIHSLSIAHCDIKTDNFLCKGANPILKLCDFGLARTLPFSGKLFGTCGTPFYMSPEMVSTGPYNLKTDIWSLGVILYLMLYGHVPYEPHGNSKIVMRAIASGTPEPSFEGKGFMSSMARETAIMLLHRQMCFRPSAAQVLELPFSNTSSRMKVLEPMLTRHAMDFSLEKGGSPFHTPSDPQSTCISYMDDGSDMIDVISVGSDMTDSTPRHRTLSL